MLNEDKTEVIVFSPTDHSQATSLDLGSLSAFRSSCVLNLGVHFDDSLKLEKQISSVIDSSFYQLRLLSKIKHFLNVTTSEMAVHARAVRLIEIESQSGFETLQFANF